MFNTDFKVKSLYRGLLISEVVRIVHADSLNVCVLSLMETCANNLRT